MTKLTKMAGRVEMTAEIIIGSIEITKEVETGMKKTEATKTGIEIGIEIGE